MQWLEDWFGTAKQVVFSPDAFYAGAEPSDDFTPGMRFAVTSLVISGVLNGVLMLAFFPFLGMGVEDTLLKAALQPVAGVIGGTLGLLLSAGIVHVFVYLLGGSGYVKSVDIVAYATAAQAFFGWIPVLNVLASLYVIYIQARGIEHFHDFSFGRALVAAVAPLLFILLAIIVGVFLFIDVPAGVPFP